jgi:hypothetical protein
MFLARLTKGGILKPWVRPGCGVTDSEKRQLFALHENGLIGRS